MITENAGDFNRLEKEIYKFCCKIGCELLKTALETWDSELAQSRDRQIYRHKGKRKTVVKTVMGEVEYERNMYKHRSETGEYEKYVYLLDIAMGKTGNGFYSGLLSEQIVQASCEGAYRSAARSVSELTGQNISHTAAWRVVQELGKRVEIDERSVKRHETTKKLEAKLLFEEQDGIWLNLQGKSRKEHGKSKEMKLGIAYDGCISLGTSKKTGKTRYKLTNKVACASFESAEKFVKRKEAVIAKTYNTDEIEMRFLNGDGAAWIKQSISDETVHFQLDPFHRNKAIRSYVINPEVQEQITELLYEKKIDTLLDYIEAMKNSVEDEREQENYGTLLTYFRNNKDGLIPCHRQGHNVPKAPKDKEYRRLGAMESNIFTILGNRMKGRRACWSIDGGGNLARLLCLKFTNKLSDTLSNLTSLVLPHRYAEEIEIKMSAKQVALREGKGYNGFKQMTIPSEMKWLKDMVSMKSLLDF